MTAGGRLEGTVAFITGAARGIGAAIARRFAQEGARLILTDGDEVAVRGLAASISDRAQARALDVSSEAEWEHVVASALASAGRVDVLVNNAGVSLAAKLEDTTLAEFRRLQEVNRVGVFLGMRTLTPRWPRPGVARSSTCPRSPAWWGPPT